MQNSLYTLTKKSIPSKKIHQTIYPLKLIPMTHLIIHDQQKNKIEFKDSRFYPCHDSKDSIYVPSVTTILDCAPKGKGFYDWLKK
jgi:hypothetical protein